MVHHLYLFLSIFFGIRDFIEVGLSAYFLFSYSLPKS